MNAKYVVEGCKFRILQRVERERGRKLSIFFRRKGGSKEVARR
jgi:hypothetical protein